MIVICDNEKGVLTWGVSTSSALHNARLHCPPASKNIRIYIAETEDVASGILDKLFFLK